MTNVVGVLLMINLEAAGRESSCGAYVVFDLLNSCLLIGTCLAFMSLLVNGWGAVRHCVDLMAGWEGLMIQPNFFWDKVKRVFKTYLIL